MAIKKVIEIDVEQVKAMGGLDALQQSMQKTEEKSASLKTELRKLKEQLSKLPEGSEEYNKIAQKAGEVSDKLGDINTRIKNLGSDTKNIDAVVQGTQALSGAFTVATSASALLGEENKDLQETMAKVESAIGLTVGIQSVANALQKETALSIGLNTIATKIQIGAQLAYTAVVGGTTGALKALRVALVSTGVGAIVVLLGYLIAKLTESKEATEDQTQAQERLNASLEQSQKLFDKTTKEIDTFTKIRVLRAKIAGASEKELQSIEKEAHEERLANIKAEKERLYELLNDKNISLETSKKINDALLKNNQDFIDEVNNQEIKGLEVSLELADKKREAEKKASEEAKRKAKERADKLVQIEKERYAKLLEEADAYFKNATDKQNEYDKFLEDRLQRTKDFEASFESPEDKANRELNAQLKTIENSKVGYEEKLNILNEFNNSVLSNEELTEEAKRQLANETLEYKKLLQEQELALVGQTFGKLATIFGEQSKIGKAFAISQALINTYQGITAELATKALTPYEIGLKVVNVAYIAKTGFDSVKKILSTNPQSAGGSSPSGVGGSAQSSTPQFNIVGQNSNNQLAQTIGQQQQQPIQAYVVAGNITTAQSLDRNKIDTATFN